MSGSLRLGVGRVSAGLLALAVGQSFGSIEYVSILAADRDSADVRVTARLRDADSDAPLMGALIEVSGQSRRHVTGTDGRAAFDVPAGRHTLTARKGGYVTLRVDFRVVHAGELVIVMHELGDLDTSIPGRLLVSVTESGSGRSIGGATVTLAGRQARATDGEGWVEFGNLTEPVADVTVEVFGYETRTEPISLQAGRTTVVELAMAIDAVVLAPLEVEAESRFLEKWGVYWRIDRNRVNKVLTRKDLVERANPRLSDAFRNLAGVRVENRGHYTVVVGRGGCQLSVFLDGLPLSFTGLDIDDLQPEQLELAEVFWAERTPPRFDLGGCGAVALWSRRRAFGR